MSHYEDDPILGQISFSNMNDKLRKVDRERIETTVKATGEKVVKELTHKTKSNGGPSSYYDFDEGWTTFNDFAEHKAETQWGAYSIHFKDIGKAMCRFGAKEGTNDAYDARKIIYSGLRLLGMIEGKEAMRAELLALLDDEQFK